MNWNKKYKEKNLSVREQYMYWYRGLRVGRSKRFANISQCWNRLICPTRGTPAWDLFAYGFEGGNFN